MLKEQLFEGHKHKKKSFHGTLINKVSLKEMIENPHKHKLLKNLIKNDREKQTNKIVNTNRQNSWYERLRSPVEPLKNTEILHP